MENLKYSSQICTFCTGASVGLENCRICYQVQLCKDGLFIAQVSCEHADSYMQIRNIVLLVASVNKLDSLCVIEYSLASSVRSCTIVFRFCTYQEELFSDVLSL